VSKGVSFLLKFVMIILVPATMLMVTFSEVVINILFGSRYLGASTSLQILSFGAIFYSLLTIYSTTLASIGRPDASTKITIFVGLFNLAANFVLVQAMGIIGAAIATSSAYLIGLALYHAYFRHLINARIKIVDITKTVAGAFLSLAVLFLLKEMLYMDVLIESAITLVAALSIYAVFIVKARTLEKNDIDILKASRLPIPSAVMKVLEKNSR
jgi:O-antigen/teichoic acid export membrane protein